MQTLTRATFNAAAEHVKYNIEPALRRPVAEAFATIFAASNPRFDQERFMEACGVGPVGSANTIVAIWVPRYPNGRGVGERAVEEIEDALNSAETASIGESVVKWWHE